MGGNAIESTNASCSMRAVGRQTGRRRVPKFQDSDIGEDLCALLRLAEFYGLFHLKQWSEQQLVGLLSADNVVALSTHAYFCNASQLLPVCVYQMQLMYSELVDVEEWEDLEPAIRELVLTDRGSADVSTS